MSGRPKAGEPKLQVQRISDPAADYCRLSGIIDKSFSIAVLGAITKPTALDLKDVTSVTSQGVERWCDLIRKLPSTTALYLLQVPDCFSTQIQYVPNFLGHAELVTVIAVARCTGCQRAVPSMYDLMSFTDGAQPLDRCGQCGAAMVAIDIDLQQLAKRRARALPPELCALLARVGIYKKRVAPNSKPFEVQRLMEGRTNLMRLSGTFDEKFRWLRMLDGLEGTLLIDAAQLEVTPPQFKKLGDVLHQMIKVASRVLLIDAPAPAVEAIVAQRALLAPLFLHSVLAPCYCATCDEIRPISVDQGSLLSEEPQAVCPRCGREAPLVAGTIAIESLHEMLRPAPADVLPIIGRLDELFSSAEVEAKLTGSANTTPPPDGATAPPDRIGPYRIIRTIAAGGMATVFLAVRDDFTKPMALKLLRHEILQQARISLTMFLREARLSARLNHPNIIQVFDVDESEGNLYIVMEYLEGHALWRILGQYARPFPPRIALRIVGQVLRALQHAHTARDSDGQPLSIVHRDVSPSNILIGVDGNVKLIDFGIALAGTTPDVLAGNPAWMSPEQFAGGALDGRSDLFSAATVLHELLLGKQLFTGANVGEIGGQVVNAVLRPPPGIPASLARVLAKAHERAPQDRYQTAAEFAEALRAVSADVGGEASEHEVRGFITDALAAPRRTPTSHELALCETPLSEPHQLQPKRKTSKKMPVQRPTPSDRAAVAVSLADTPEAGAQLTPPTGTFAPARADHGFDAPPSNSRHGAALLPLADPRPNRTATVVIVALVAVSLGLLGLLTFWLL